MKGKVVLPVFALAGFATVCALIVAVAWSGGDAAGQTVLVTRFAGTGIEGFSGDGGPALDARLRRPIGIDVAPDGAVYFADAHNNVVRRVRADGIIERVAGTGSSGFGGDGGSAMLAQLATPADVQVLQDGRVLIADYGNNRVRVVGADGIIDTLAQLPNNVRSVAVDEAADVIYASTDVSQIFTIDAGGNATLYAGTLGPTPISPDGTPALEARLGCLHDIEASSGIVYMAVDPCTLSGGKVLAIIGGVLTTIGGPVDASLQGLEIVGQEFLGAGAHTLVGAHVYSIGEVSSAVVIGGGTCTDFDAGCAPLDAKLGRTGDIAIGASGDAFVTESHSDRILRVDGFRPPTPTLVPRYAGLGDSAATGHSIPSWEADPLEPATNGYPLRLGQYLQLLRPGIRVDNQSMWGHTTTDVISGQLPLLCFFGCPEIVTITVGANDFEFSDIPYWYPQRGKDRRESVAERAEQLRLDLRALINSVRLQVPEAEIFITNYANPADRRTCRTYYKLAEDILWAKKRTGLNDVIAEVAAEKGVHLVDIYDQFKGHGIESAEPYFFGTDCDVPTLILNWPEKAALGDPHPNSMGQQCIANILWEHVKTALRSDIPPVSDPCLDAQ